MQAYSQLSKSYWLSVQLAAETTGPVLHKIHRSKRFLLRRSPNEDISDKIQTGIRKSISKRDFLRKQVSNGPMDVFEFG